MTSIFFSFFFGDPLGRGGTRRSRIRIRIRTCSKSILRIRIRTPSPTPVRTTDPEQDLSTGEATGTGPVPPGPDRPFSDPPKNPGLGWSHLWDPPQNPGLGWSHLWSPGRPGPGTGTVPGGLTCGPFDRTIRYDHGVREVCDFTFLKVSPGFRAFGYLR
jgi:hypothetical protein